MNRDTTEDEVYAKAHSGAMSMLLLPFLWFITFALLVVRARLQLGFWPHPSRGNIFDGTWEPSPIDPKSFGLHRDLVWVGALPAALSLVVALLMLFASAFAPSLWRSLSFLGGLLVIGALIVGLATVGADFLDWFVD